jgi:predicted transcriptional regulator
VKRDTEQVISIRLSGDTLEQIDRIAEEQERSRASVISRAVRAYAEEEYDRLIEILETEREMDEGKSVPHDRAVQLIEDLKVGKPWPAELK